MEVTRTLRLKVWPEACPWLDVATREVNRQWNRVGALSREINGQYIDMPTHAAPWSVPGQ